MTWHLIDTTLSLRYKIGMNENYRLQSLDVFRGITIAAMMLVNLPGNDFVYSWIDHSSWNGCTLADLVFPFFIYIVGVSLALSLSKKMHNGVSTRELYLDIARRTVVIFLLGLALNAFPYHFFDGGVRVLGVLQRIALCYFVASALFITYKPSVQLWIMLLLLIGYWLLMSLMPVPGFGRNNLTPLGNLATYIDQSILGVKHLYAGYDPEGLLSTLPAIVTAMMGAMSGLWLLAKPGPRTKTMAMVMVGLLCLGAGWVWGFWFPINKSLWSSSYVLWTGGWALLGFAVLYWVVDVKRWQSWTLPFVIFGRNAIAAYILHVFFLKIQLMIHLPRKNGAPGNVRSYLTEHVFGGLSLYNASLGYALSSVFFWFIILTLLYKKKIFIRIG